MAAAGLVLGPLLFLLDVLIDPAWAKDDATYLDEVAANEAAYLAGEIASTIGALFLIAGMAGVVRLLREDRVAVGQIAAVLVAVGLIGLTGSFAFSVLDLAMADFSDRAAMVELRAELEDSGAYRAFWLVFSAGATVGGLIVLAGALYRKRIVPAWSPAAILAGALVWSVIGGEQAAYATAWLLLAAGLAPLATRVGSLT